MHSFTQNAFLLLKKATQSQFRGTSKKNSLPLPHRSATTRKRARMVENTHSGDPFTVRDTLYKKLGPLQLTEASETIMRFMTPSSVLFVNKQWYQAAQYTLEENHIMTVDSAGIIHEE